jgi:2-methylisocitrate lyase-like PEP mutase family enzyme
MDGPAVTDAARRVWVAGSVDAERGHADDPAGVAETVRMLAEARARGVSIEDYDPATGRIDPVDVAVEPR